MDEVAASGLGCGACWPATPDAAWAARSRLSQAELIDEPHYRVALLSCPACGQTFLSVFTETVDWADGEDPQYWITLPLTAVEHAGLAGTRPTDAQIAALGPGRRSLHRDYPKGGELVTRWGTGIHVRAHD